MLINKKYFQIVVMGCLLGWLAFFLFQKLDLAVVDLGRFLKNGENIFNGNWRAVLQTNFYSFSFPGFSFLNHHWATGVVFYLVYQLGGFAFLHLFAVALIFATFGLLFQIARKEVGWSVAIILAALLIPLMAYRQEIRPEIFSGLFSAVFFYILWGWRNKEFSAWWLWALPVFEILWVNLHIYFFLGPAILGAFLLEKIIFYFKNKAEKLKLISGVFVAVLFATLANPFGWKGALHPFFVYGNYGYRILEEQTIWFLENLKIHHPSFILFQIMLGALVLSFAWIAFKKRAEFQWANFFVAGGFSFMACWSIRNLSLFGFFALPILASNLKIILPKISLNNFNRKMVCVGLAFIIVLTVLIGYWRYLPTANDRFGLGLLAGTNDSAVFWQEHNLQGPIFNNYDIGAYLIYHLFPSEKVFVDNRPETYPVEFFDEIYIPLQENEEIWREKSEEYGFNALFFYFRDATPWGQKFLIARVQDENWASVFADERAIIFLKRNELNKIIIDEFEIPREMFRVN